MKRILKEINKYLGNFKDIKTVVGIDGYSGTGKTTISNEIAQNNKDIKLLHLDDYATTSNTIKIEVNFIRG